MDCVLWTGSLAQLYAASWGPVKLPGGCRLAWEASGRGCLWKRDRKTPAHPFLHFYGKAERRGKCWCQQGVTKGQKTDTSPQSVWSFVCTERCILPCNQNRILSQTGVLNLKASCKDWEGWKNTTEELSLALFHRDLQPKPQEQWKPLLLCLGTCQGQQCCWKASLEKLITKPKKKGSEVSSLLLAAFLSYPSPTSSQLAYSTDSPNLDLLAFHCTLRNTNQERAPS